MLDFECDYCCSYALAIIYSGW